MDTFKLITFAAIITLAASQPVPSSDDGLGLEPTVIAPVSVTSYCTFPASVAESFLDKRRPKSTSVRTHVKRFDHQTFGGGRICVHDMSCRVGQMRRVDLRSSFRTSLDGVQAIYHINRKSTGTQQHYFVIVDWDRCM